MLHSSKALWQGTLTTSFPQYFKQEPGLRAMGESELPVSQAPRSRTVALPTGFPVWRTYGPDGDTPKRHVLGIQYKPSELPGFRLAPRAQTAATAKGCQAG